MSNVVSWFEIPVADMNRAKKFYQNVFKKELMDMTNPMMEMWAFPWKPGAEHSAGAIIKSEFAKPSSSGTIVYFECDDLAVELARVETNGGKISSEKMSIGEFGFIGHALDTEGNKIGFHSTK